MSDYPELRAQSLDAGAGRCVGIGMAICAHSRQTSVHFRIGPIPSRNHPLEGALEAQTGVHELQFVHRCT